MHFLVRVLSTIVLIGTGWAVLRAQPALSARFALIPQPVSIRAVPGLPATAHCRLSGAARLQADPTVAPALAALCQAILLESRPAGGPSATVVLGIDSVAVPQREGYRLRLTPTHLTLTGHDAAGLFYGLQSLRQLAEQAAPAGLPCGQINDYPRFAYRGMQLDVSRHLFSVDFLKKYLDLLALYKINTFHWHLTDDQGWRIEIRRFPALQQTAAFRRETLIGHKKDLPHRFDGKRYGGYYTQDQIRELVRYAADRHITVIPEIDMPGHALAALSAFPELGCQRPDGQPGGPYEAATFWGIFDDVFCAGTDSTFTVLTQILDEVVSLFPSRYIHIGGDECPKTRWKTCPRCQARIRREGLRDEHELQRYFIRRIDAHLTRRGRQLLGWDEILEGGSPALTLSPGAAVMSWRGIAGGVAAMRQHHYAVMTPETHVYFDYYQSLHPGEPLAAAGYTPLRKTYSYEPLPDSLTADEARYLLGVQGNVWSEYLPTTGQAEHQIFPRALAVAEIGWSPRSQRHYPDFLRRLRLHMPRLRARHVQAADSFDELTDTVQVDADGRIGLTLRTTRPGATIRYTTSGQTPTATSPVYTAPLRISRSGTVQAQLFAGGRAVGRRYTQAFRLSKASGKPVTMDPLPLAPYRPGSLLRAVNGVAGTSRYNTGEWLGLPGTDFAVTVDLGRVQPVARVGTHVLNYPWQRMWPPVVLTVLLSTDGVTFRPVGEHRRFPLNGINPIETAFTTQPARYVRLTATALPIIPVGQYGAGGKPWLLFDDITVD
ncbi:family 20 glycosylhydrolase [Spirosoma luteolum]